MIIRMASKRGLKRRSCTGKVRYLTFEAALIGRRWCKRRGYTGDLVVYACGSHWHVGHINDCRMRQVHGVYKKGEWNRT